MPAQHAPGRDESLALPAQKEKMTPKTLRELALALSAANLCLLRVWHALLVRSIYIPTPAGLDYLAAIVNTGLLTAVFWLFLAAGRLATISRFAGWLRRLPFLALLMPLNFLRTLLPDYFSQEVLVRNLGKAGFLSLGGGLAVCCAYVVFRWHRALLSALEILVLCFVPFAAVTLLQAAWFGADDPAVSRAGKSPAGEVTARQDSGPRILVLIFDEWDYRLSFPERPRGLQLPELDRICSQALVATSAYAPAHRTARAVPALLTGKLVSKESVEDGRMMITFAGTEKAVDFSTQNHLFAEAHRAGLPTAVTAWFFPYCRVLGDSLTRCTWIANSPPLQSLEPELSGKMRVQLTGILPWAPRQEAIIKYQRILEDAKRLVAKPGPGLILVHWSIPHYPPIYNRRTGALSVTLFRNLTDWYLDNLVLVDRTVTEIRQTMESVGTWDRTTILLTADHPWRSSAAYDGKTDHRVPFVLKLPGQTTGIAYHQSFNTILVHDLLLAVMRGELHRPEDVPGWMDQHRSFAASPHYFEQEN